MKISRVTLPAGRSDEIAAFYQGVLKLPVTTGSDATVVHVGTTRLMFEEQHEPLGAEHLAFTIPTGSFGAARTWLRNRVPLLSRDGIDEFEGPTSWNSRSLYFSGPRGQVLELIERRDLRQPYEGGFGPEQLLCVSEVGVLIPNVPVAVDQLSEAGLDSYGNPPEPDFAAVGDADGMLILVSPGRPWLPTDDRLPSASMITIQADIAQPIQLDHGRVTLAPRRSTPPRAR